MLVRLSLAPLQDSLQLRHDGQVFGAARGSFKNDPFVEIHQAHVEPAHFLTVRQQILDAPLPAGPSAGTCLQSFGLQGTNFPDERFCSNNRSLRVSVTAEPCHGLRIVRGVSQHVTERWEQGVLPFPRGVHQSADTRGFVGELQPCFHVV